MSRKDKIITTMVLPAVFLFLFTSLLYAEPKGNPPGPKDGPGADQRFNRDNNPPGPRGGEGTNWDNPPGPKGGPGASPDTMQEKAVVDRPWEKAADANKDGIVDQTEMHQWRQGRLNKGDDSSLEPQGYSGSSSDTKQEKAAVDRPWEKAADANKDGMVDQTEIQQWKQGRPDIDNNPPGPRGGEGTNWDNPPGPKGGPGASPDRPQIPPPPPKRDFDNNPPGPKGGPGTNWENKPGPAGGPGAGPDRKGQGQSMGNPPGPKGGPGVSPERRPMGNPPGPKGGPGAGPGGPRGGGRR